MGIEAPFQPALAVIGILRSPSFPLAAVEAGIEGTIGRLGWRGPELPFGWSDYYRAEMGPDLVRGFCALKGLVDPASLAALKRATDSLEASWSREGKRPVNLDPGILSLGSFILATTKAKAHRIPLDGGIHAELTLIYQEGSYRPLPWTYPDWQSPAYLAVLAELRAKLKEELRLPQSAAGG
jgi:hypothetical protein